MMFNCDCRDVDEDLLSFDLDGIDLARPPKWVTAKKPWDEHLVLLLMPTNDQSITLLHMFSQHHGFIYGDFRFRFLWAHRRPIGGAGDKFLAVCFEHVFCGSQQSALTEVGHSQTGEKCHNCGPLSIAELVRPAPAPPGFSIQALLR
ncbi:hypothetical protein PAPYR_5986 [Paratrimastix pyriformis]|uniref:Uncharacterized protein n=1 Tax=Paratrimastix pyriformis TaxID=342808 RepID=A0ABQ8UGB8_9EUKA|nr:hypothetical protein PAPYR_5986 [Paratrimastix pyriformis]